MGENVYNLTELLFDVTMQLPRRSSVYYFYYLVWLMKYSAYVRKNVADFSRSTPERISPSPNDKKARVILCGLTSNKFPAVHVNDKTSKDNEDPSWNTSFKTMRTYKTTSVWKRLKTLFNPNQPDVIPVIPEPVLVDEDEDPKEEEFEEEEEPQKEEAMDIDDEEDENEPELTFPYEETNPLNLPPPTSDLEPEDVIEVEDMVKPEDEAVLASVHKVGESSTATFLQEDDDSLLSGFMRRDINSLFDLDNEVRSSMEEGTAALDNLVRKLGNAEERAECKKLRKELEEARSSITLLRMQKERVERDLYWT
ncbi:hypothetical protein Tco_1242909, partial [Tanacetum coccineum]